jgi:hypothetical protein
MGKIRRRQNSQMTNVRYPDVGVFHTVHGAMFIVIDTLSLVVCKPSKVFLHILFVVSAKFFRFATASYFMIDKCSGNA